MKLSLISDKFAIKLFDCFINIRNSLSLSLSPPASLRPNMHMANGMCEVFVCEHVWRNSTFEWNTYNVYVSKIVMKFEIHQIESLMQLIDSVRRLNRLFFHLCFALSQFVECFNCNWKQTSRSISVFKFPLFWLGKIFEKKSEHSKSLRCFHKWQRGFLNLIVPFRP